MDVSHDELSFITRRSRLVRTWPLAGSALLIMAAGLTAWLFFSRPLLANPLTVWSRLDENSLPESELVVMAAMLPVVVLACLALLIVLILFGFVAFANEKKYLSILERTIGSLNRPDESGAAGDV
jgi:hypothetical protein